MGVDVKKHVISESPKFVIVTEKEVKDIKKSLRKTKIRPVRTKYESKIPLFAEMMLKLAKKETVKKFSLVSEQIKNQVTLVN